MLGYERDRTELLICYLLSKLIIVSEPLYPYTSQGSFSVIYTYVYIHYICVYYIHIYYIYIMFSGGLLNRIFGFFSLPFNISGNKVSILLSLGISMEPPWQQATVESLQNSLEEQACLYCSVTEQTISISQAMA